MAKCPNCGNATTVFDRDVFSGLCTNCHARVTPVRLGCGTLIVIAIIVVIFGQAGREELGPDVRRLQNTLEEFQETLESQTAEIRDLSERIDSLLAVGPR